MSIEAGIALIGAADTLVRTLINLKISWAEVDRVFAQAVAEQRGLTPAEKDFFRQRAKAAIDALADPPAPPVAEEGHDR